MKWTWSKIVQDPPSRQAYGKLVLADPNREKAIHDYYSHGSFYRRPKQDAVPSREKAYGKLVIDNPNRAKGLHDYVSSGGWFYRRPKQQKVPPHEAEALDGSALRRLQQSSPSDQQKSPDSSQHSTKTA